MGCAGRRHPPGHRGAPGRRASACREAGGRAAGEPVGGVPAPEDPQGRRPGGGHRGGDAPDLPAQPGRAGGAAGSARYLLAAGAGRVRPSRRSAGRGGVMTQADAATVRKQVVVDAPIERAFTVFTERFGDFKPPEHNLLGAPIAETVFEPKVGGHIYDKGVDGSECRWARVLAYEPPDRVVFSWDISPQWQIETDPDNTSEVEVRFVAETPQRTRVELEHRHLHRHGPGWQAVSDGVAHDEGWPLYLARYAALFTDGR